MRKDISFVKRPIIKIKKTLPDYASDIAALLGIIFIIILLIMYWHKMPQIIPRHYNSDGKVDLFGNKMILLVLPILSLLFYLVFSLAERFPHLFYYPFNITAKTAEYYYRGAMKLLNCIKIEIIWIFAYFEWKIIRMGLGLDKNVKLIYLPLFILIILVTYLIYFIKMRNRYLESNKRESQKS